jgi:hypothetical protein
VSKRPASFAVDQHDRIVKACDEHDAMTAFLGHSLWEYLPQAEPILGPYFDHARSSGQEVEAAIFYGGALVELRIVPSRLDLAVIVTRRVLLDVSTLGTLAASLVSIEVELGARAPSRPGRPAPASRRALL